MNTFHCGDNPSCENQVTHAIIEIHTVPDVGRVTISRYLCEAHKSAFLNRPPNGVEYQEKTLQSYLVEIGHPSTRGVER